MKNSRSFLLPLLALFGTTTFAQLPSVDLTMADNGRGQLEIRVRPDAYFDGLFAATVFTIRWNASAGNALSECHFVYPTIQYMYTEGTDEVLSSDGYTYRIYTGFGNSAMSNFGLAWEAGHEYPLCTIDILTPGTTFELIQNDVVQAHNGPYYVSLNGQDRTGEFFDSAVPTISIRSNAANNEELKVSLIPEENYFGWVTELGFTVRWPQGSDTHLGSPTSPSTIGEFLTLEKEGVEIVQGGYVYQRFRGSGTKSIAHAKQAWFAGVAQEILNVPIIGTGAGMQIVNDMWTANNDGDYAIILNGLGRTGAIEEITTGFSPLYEGTFTMRAFKQNDQLNVQVTTPQAGTLFVALMNAKGQLVHSTSSKAQMGTNSQRINVGDLTTGVYILKTQLADHVEVRRILL